MASGNEGQSEVGLNQNFLMAEEASRELLKIPILRHHREPIESDIVAWDLALFLLTLSSSVCR